MFVKTDFDDRLNIELLLKTASIVCFIPLRIFSTALALDAAGAFILFSFIGTFCAMLGGSGSGDMQMCEFSWVIIVDLLLKFDDIERDRNGERCNVGDDVGCSNGSCNSIQEGVQSS